MGRKKHKKQPRHKRQPSKSVQSQRNYVFYTSALGVANLEAALIQDARRQTGKPLLSQEEYKKLIQKKVKEYPNGLFCMKF